MDERRLARVWRLGDFLDEIAALTNEGDPARCGGGPGAQYPSSTGNRSSSGSGCTPSAFSVIDTLR